ncbi:MAG: glycosyl transferase family 2 [Burkholderiales bacterium]|jgi:abequosyltransferase|nr:glycosyl transferase family 2 [Burkholderiales bacterium]
MSHVILSICIPVYNRKSELEYLLNNIILQLDEGALWNNVEICISDNASNDGTDILVASYMQRYKNIVYTCNHENVGFDRNLLHSLDIANGKYCWLFGSDDRFEPQAIAAIVKYLQQHAETVGITVNVQNYDSNFTQKIRNTSFRSDKDFIVNSVADTYIKLGQSFSFISAQIIRKKIWDETISKQDITKYYNGYIHLYILANIVKENPKWIYLSQFMVGWRSGNDSALEPGAQGYIKRLRLDYAYYDIASAVFGKRSWIYFWHGNQVCGQCIFANLQNMKANGKVNILPLFKEVTQLCWLFPIYYIKIIPLFFIPAKGLLLLKKFKQAYRNLRM